jgi:predicted DNA-binding transcriptional regulator YafY
MNRLDRALGILLMLRSGASISALELARHFEVSPRTIYRDIEALSAAGVPVYAEMGRNGGFRLTEGYFLPPVMFSVREATALLLCSTLLRRMRAMPFAGELEDATRKVLASLPEHMRAALARAEHGIGFEMLPVDLLHPEPEERLPFERACERAYEGVALSTFVEAMLTRVHLALRYRSPYRQGAETEHVVAPCGLVWDRDRWYLVGRASGASAVRFWRADRVVKARLAGPMSAEAQEFDLRDVLDRRWLDSAMAIWTAEAPVVLQLTRLQAERLRQDWYYSHAQFADLPDGRVQMTFGEDDPAIVLALIRWLGPEAVLLEPRAWRALLRDELLAMLGALDD